MDSELDFSDWIVSYGKFVVLRYDFLSKQKDCKNSS